MSDPLWYIKPTFISFLYNFSSIPFSLLGIPKGLGASFKLLDKERDRMQDSDEGPCTKPLQDKDHYLDAHRSEEHISLENLHLGWTSIVEDWLCNGGITLSCMKTLSTASIGLPQPLIRQKSMKGARKGPYQLLIKERLMGIYMAIYIHRDLRSSVQGRATNTFKVFFPYQSRNVEVCRRCWAHWWASG
jgi:hypothetical protein